MPGGVNSPVRSFGAVGGDPIFFSRARGSVLYDVDGNEYIDYVASWGPMILGHAHPEVLEAVHAALNQSTSFGAPTEVEVEIASLITEMAPKVEKVRMVNSGTEACMSAIRLARGYTQRNKIIKFKGCYHGHADSFLIQAGSGASTLGVPDSPGVTEGTAKDTLIADFNSINDVKNLVSSFGGEVAAIILEPVAGNMGCIPPRDGFLKELRAICDESEILLIFDEVMTGFRLAPGGAQQVYGIEPDLVSFGKIIGGGMPVGAYGGRQEIMQYVSPDGPVYQAGTLSGNPVAMTCGLKTLGILQSNPEIYQKLEDKGSWLENELTSLFNDHAFPIRINRVGSMMSLHFTEQEVMDYDSAASASKSHFNTFFHGCLNGGVYLPPSPFESWFLSHSLTEDQLSKTVEVIKQVLRKM